MELIRAELITIGDEILYGQTLDTNSYFISQKLDEIGISIVRKTTIADNESVIMQGLKEAEQRADITIITGGLGPTNDDCTKVCLARFFDSPLTIHKQVLHDVTEYFTKRGKELTDLNRQQAALPECCEMIRNPKGTAPGMWFNKNGKIFVALPGVPHEMKYLVSNEVAPRIKKVFHLPVIYHKMIKTVGIGESFLADKIKSWEQTLPPHIQLAYLPSAGEVKLRLTAKGSEKSRLKNEVNRLVEQLEPLTKDHIYGYDDDQLEEVVGKMLLKNHKTLSLAESCTGGFLAHAITRVPGSSAYFKGGVVAYHNDIKLEQLQVPPDVLHKYGAVSEEVVKIMAENVRNLFDTDIGLAISGIAGPGGGTPEKPVGLVWAGYADENEIIAKKMLFVKDRLFNIELSSKAVLYLLLRKLKQID